jgi:hypothetical protein
MLSYTTSSCSLASMSDEEDEILTGTQLPLRRRENFFERKDDAERPAAEPRSTAWLISLATHPVIATIAGLMHLVGFHRVASMVARRSSSIGAEKKILFFSVDLLFYAGSFSESLTSSPEDELARREATSRASEPDAPS